MVERVDAKNEVKHPLVGHMLQGTLNESNPRKKVGAKVGQLPVLVQQRIKGNRVVPAEQENSGRPTPGIQYPLPG
jgi:hypothetical protein